MPTPSIALLGHGEAGSAFAHDLVALGIPVRVYDPAVDVRPGPLVDVADDERSAVAGVDLVLSVNSASVALEVLHKAIAATRPGAVWADLNTASPGLKRQLAAVAADVGRAFVDIAIMAPVPGKGITVPMLASGPGAEQVVGILSTLGTPITLQPGGAGAAAERKLLRSVFFKGMSAAVVEALQAARAAGCEDWLRANIVGELTAAGPETVDRLVEGTLVHARRRLHEMRAAAEMLKDLGVEPNIAAASADQLEGLQVAKTRRDPPTG